ncbi:hypothetical protein ACWOAH_10295 [Vagococcus vulneris]|uniref:Uncharacterized protein n=1 Tax=Vagococcus vulneris TaxID=1977869 RepID=A0A429ZTB3_9ENTE|nr:hypothetical protein [Vagococcus vulneris]RST96975.1 hypothetical protein CBF37_10495 [Vagococcus vulneris]
MNSLEDLTNDSKYLLASMYKLYIEKRKNGLSKDEATNFNDSGYLHKEVMPRWSIEDVIYSCRELKKCEFLTYTFYGENHLILITMTPRAISLMESQFKDKVDSVIDYVAKIKGLIPFI